MGSRISPYPIHYFFYFFLKILNKTNQKLILGLTQSRQQLFQQLLVAKSNRNTTPSTKDLWRILSICSVISFDVLMHLPSLTIQFEAKLKLKLNMAISINCCLKPSLTHSPPSISPPLLTPRYSLYHYYFHRVY